MCVAGAAIALGSLALAQPADGQAPARQPADQRPARDGGGQPGRPGGQPGDGRQDARRGGGEITSVDSAMKLINRSVRRLKGQITDAAKKEDNLKLVGDIERAIVAAKGMPLPDLNAPRGRGPGGGGRGNEGGGREEPGGALRQDPNAPTTTEAPPERGAQPKEDAKQPEHKPEAAPDPKKTEEFRRELMKLLRQVIDLEQDVMDGKLDQAKTDLDKVPQIRDEAHKELGVRQERDEK